MIHWTRIAARPWLHCTLAAGALLVPTLLLCLLPEVAHACPVCGQAREESRVAYIITTTVMTFMPLALIGGVVYFIWRRYRRLDEGERLDALEAAAEDGDAAAPSNRVVHTAPGPAE